MKNKTLICMVGLPRSGKTTWAQRQNLPIVCPDAIRFALHGERYIQLAEPHVWAIAQTMVRALFLAGHEMVILDATNTMRDRRKMWVSADWNTYFQPIPTSGAVCIERAQSESDHYIIPIIERMVDQFEPIAEDEPRWDLVNTL